MKLKAVLGTSHNQMVLLAKATHHSLCDEGEKKFEGLQDLENADSTCGVKK